MRGMNEHVSSMQPTLRLRPYLLQTPTPAGRARRARAWPRQRGRCNGWPRRWRCCRCVGGLARNVNQAPQVWVLAGVLQGCRGAGLDQPFTLCSPEHVRIILHLSSPSPPSLSPPFSPTSIPGWSTTPPQASPPTTGHLGRTSSWLWVGVGWMRGRP